MSKRNSEKARILVWTSVVLALVGAMALRALVRRPEKASYREPCFEHLKQTGLAVLMYATDCDDRLPPAKTWADSVLTYCRGVKSRFTCPDIPDLKPGQYGHAFRSSLSLRSYTTIPDPASEPLLFDSTDLSWNAHGTLALLPPDRHPRGLCAVAYADGHTRARSWDEFAELSTRQRKKPTDK